MRKRKMKKAFQRRANAPPAMPVAATPSGLVSWRAVPILAFRIVLVFQEPYRSALPFADQRRLELSALPSFTADDPGDFLHPSPPLGVLEREQLLVRPVEMVGDIGYLLVEPVEGVAYDSPGDSGSDSKVC